jgi:hypothetical protein
VDGQEMPSSDDGSNYVINTCEWLNGQHVLFATARCTSAPEGGDPNTATPLVGYSVSAFVPVIFNNLVTGIGFSQPFFDPTLGQTQVVTAVFASNSDWTLTIIDTASNTVRTATGSGTTMAFNWDGTGTGETNLPAGVYHYLISAYTNGLGPGGGGTNGGGAGGPPPPSGDEESSGSFLTSGSESGFEVIPLPPAPPGLSYGTHADGSEITTMEVHVSTNGIEGGALPAGGVHPDGEPSPASSQSTPLAPVRPPTAPVRGTVGTIGVAYQTYTENGSSGYSLADPKNCEIVGPIKIQDFPTDKNLNFSPLPEHGEEARNFIAAMKKGGWNATFIAADNQVNSSTITGSGSPLNEVNLGLLLLHGVYGSAADDCYNGCKQMYFPIGNVYGSAAWTPMGAMEFGGSTSTNGLKWMAIDACFSLYHPNWSSMQSAGIKPYNGNLHLLLGAGTTTYTDPNIEALWAKYMLTGKTPGSPMTIQAAWYQAGTDAYQLSNLSYSGTIAFAVAGDANCSGDYLLTNSPPTGSPYYNSQNVFSP